MASTAAIIRSCLIDLGAVRMPGVRRTPAGNPLPTGDEVWCFTGSMPDEYDKIVFIREGAGLNGGREMNGGFRHVMPGLTFIIRDGDQHKARRLALDIARALDAIECMTTTLSEEDPEYSDTDATHHVQAVTLTTTITGPMEEKDRQRFSYTFNARVSFQDAEPAHA